MALTKELDKVAQANGIDVKKVEYGLFASGEIKCVKPRNLMVNFFSGTYKMHKKIKIPKKGPSNPNGEPKEIKVIRMLMQWIDPDYKIKYNPAPFITSESVPITQSQLEFLKSNGIPTFRFDTQDKCRDMKIHVMRAKNMEKRIVGFEEMQQIYQDIMAPPKPPPPPTNAGIMSSVELKEYASEHGVEVPDPYDKYELRIRVQAHMDANKGANTGAGGAMKQKMMFKKNRTLKKRK